MSTNHTCLKGGLCGVDAGYLGLKLDDKRYCNKTLNQCQIRPSDGSCIADEVCASTYCKDGHCAESAQGKPCDSAKDCALCPGSVDTLWLCPADKKTCHHKQLTVGESCTYNEECVHNQCTNGQVYAARGHRILRMRQ